MSVTVGPNFPASGSQEAGPGVQMWASPSDVTADDATDANCLFTTAPEISYCLKATNFGFAIPSGATILGVRVIYKAKSSVDYLVDEYSIRLVVGGTVTGDDETVSDPWETGYRTFSRGGASTMWGLSLTPDQVNASAFGVALVAVSVSGLPAGYVDYITLEITYEPTTFEEAAVVEAATVFRTHSTKPGPLSRLSHYWPEVIPAVDDDVPRFERMRDAPPPQIAVRSRVYSPDLLHVDDSTPGWEPFAVVARSRAYSARPMRSNAVLLVAPEGQEEVCCCPFGAIVVGRRFATAIITAVDSTPFDYDPLTDPPFVPVLSPTAPNTADVVSDKFATALIVANTCTC